MGEDMVAIAHMGECSAILEAVDAEVIARRVERGELGPMGATTITTYRSRKSDCLYELAESMGGCSLYAEAGAARE